MRGMVMTIRMWICLINPSQSVSIGRRNSTKPIPFALAFFLAGSEKPLADTMTPLLASVSSTNFAISVTCGLPILRSQFLHEIRVRY